MVPLVLAACSHAGKYRHVDPPELKSAVELSGRELWPGDELRIRLEVTNPHENGIYREFGNTCRFGFRIASATGETVGRSGEICFDVPAELYIDAGETVVHGFSWIWDSSELPPGRYDVLAGLGEDGRLATAGPVRISLRADSRPTPVQPN